jgi:hypothetical protein
LRPGKRNLAFGEDGAVLSSSAVGTALAHSWTMTKYIDRSISRVRCFAGSILLAGAIAGGIWTTSNAATAIAPGPAKLSASLPATSGATVAAVYLNSRQPTSVRFYSASWTADTNGPGAGTPCSSTSLAADAVTSRVIQASGIYRRCI